MVMLFPINPLKRPTKKISCFRNGYVLADDGEQTSVPHIYAIGDIVSEKPKLTPVAIQAGRLLAQRMFSDKTELVRRNKLKSLQKRGGNHSFK